MNSQAQEDSHSDRPSNKHGRDLTVGSIPRHLVAFSGPMLAGSLIQAAYNIVNAAWVGNGLGTNSMAAITESFPIFIMLVAVAIGLTMAASILASQAYGAKDWEHLKSVVQNSSVLTIGTSILCVAAGFVFAEPLLKLIGTPPNILPLAVSYMRVFILGTPAMFGTFLAASLLRGVGDSKTPVYFQVIFLLLTAVLDPLLMFGWLHFPKMGLNGTAVAGIITQVGALASVCFYLHRKKHVISMDLRHLKLDPSTIRLMFKIGFPSMIQQSLISVSMVVIISLVNSFGGKAAAAYGIATRIDGIAFMPAMTLGAAASTLSGQNIGARLYHRVNQVFVWALLFGCGITMLVSIVALAMPEHLMRAFTSDSRVIQVGVGYLRIAAIGYMLTAVMFVSNGVINGSGHTFYTMLCTVIGLLAIRMPLALYLARLMHRPQGIWYAVLIGIAGGMLMSLAYYVSGRWKRPVSKKFMAIPEPASDEGEDIAGDLAV